jgi:xeroderma pigmentosum group C-complementing protein
MQPKQGLPLKQRSRPETTSPQVFDVIIISDTSDSSVTMTGKRSITRKGKGKGRAIGTNRNVVPDVYQEMLAEALPMQPNEPERPLKRRRTGQQITLSSPSSSRRPINLDSSNTEDDDDDVQFEDVLDPEEIDNSKTDSEEDNLTTPPKQLQTAYKDSEDESEESDLEWEGVHLLAAAQDNKPSGDLELTLVTKSPPRGQSVAPRRKMVTKAEREARLQIHKLHVLCLLSYVDRRNQWCNDSEVQASLKPLVTKKMLTFLRPQSTLSQFGQAESLKRGLDDLSRMWRTKFSITARGMRRSLWAESEQDLQKVYFSLSWLLARLQY